LITDELTL